MIEKIRGDEAARLFLDHLGLGRSGTGLAFLEKLALGFSKLPYENISKIIKSAGTEETSGTAGTAGAAGSVGSVGIAGQLESLRLPAEVARDHIERGFGGTCFSLTFLLERVLRSLGFDAYKVMADMNSGANVHCLVVVNEGGTRYMIDPGYALYRVIDLPGAPDSVASTAGAVRRVDFPHAMVRVSADGKGTYSLWTEDAGGRIHRYVFRDRPVPDSAFETYWLESFGKPTLNNICLTRMTDRGHIYFRKDFFKFTSRDSIDRRRLSEGIERLVEDEFGIAGEWTALAREILKERKSRKRSHDPEDRWRT